MARIRTVKPEFWTAEQVMELSPMARLLFIGMWNFCDDRGVHPVAYKTLKAEVFPADDLLSSDVEKMVNELIHQGLLIEFETQGRNWWFVTGWHHQVINRPSKSRYPEPPRVAPLPSAAGQDGLAVDKMDVASSDERTEIRPMNERSLSDHGVITDGREGKGGEGNGVHTTTPSHAGARDGSSVTTERFPMRLDWRPSAVFATLAHQAGLPTPGGADFESSCAEFVSYWLTRRDERTQHEWDHSFIRSLKSGQSKSKTPTRPANRSPPGAITREDSRRIAASTRLSDFRAACAAEQQEQTDDSSAIEGTATRLLG